MLGPALQVINAFQITVPLTWLAVIQSSTFESVPQPLNRRCRLQRRFKIGAVGYSADSKMAAVGYSEARNIVSLIFS
jgi:hypothetical protein